MQLTAQKKTVCEKVNKKIIISPCALSTGPSS
ncbi:MAG: hypothetical protein ACI90V_012637, partial [Bacillariaceae sp.]